MNENINLVEILKNCPKGTPLYSIVHGEVIFIKIDNSITNNYPIITAVKNRYYYQPSFNSMGKNNSFGEECLLFPSKEQRDWSKFKVKKPKFDPKTLNPFDKVLVRNYSTIYWNCDFFSRIDDSTSNHKFITISSAYIFCIPYNEETKHLVGTTEESPEFYRYWED